MESKMKRFSLRNEIAFLRAAPTLLTLISMSSLNLIQHAVLTKHGYLIFGLDDWGGFEIEMGL